MRLAIIVCTRNRSALLAECLESLRALVIADADSQVIIVDNGSTDDTAAIMAHFAKTMPTGQVLPVHEPRTGLSIARNRGIDEAGECALVAFLDDDAVVTPDWLTSCRAAFADHPEAAGIGGEILPWFTAETTPPPDWFRPPLSSYYCTFTLPGGDAVRDFPGRYHPVGVNMAFRRSVFDLFRFSESLGRSGTNLISGEETELCARIRRAGGRLLYVPPMRVRHFVHPDRLNEDWIRDRFYFEGVSRARLPMGLAERLIGLSKNLLRLVWSALRLPLLRGEFSRLLAQCQLRRAQGYLAEILSPSK